MGNGLERSIDATTTAINVAITTMATSKIDQTELLIRSISTLLCVLKPQLLSTQVHDADRKYKLARLLDSLAIICVTDEQCDAAAVTAAILPEAVDVKVSITSRDVTKDFVTDGQNISSSGIDVDSSNWLQYFLTK